MDATAALNKEFDEAAQPSKIIIPYTPREHFLRLHNSKKRFQFSCAHRRAGKSVSQINHIIKKALENKRPYPPPRYGYVGPSFAQTKDLIWGYSKHYTAPLPDVVTHEGDLQIILPNGAMINLYGGAAAYERMRGLYFDGIVLDEFPLLNPSVFSTVVRPCLADYRGWGIVSGTSNGDDHFHALKKRAEADPDGWDVHIIPVTETDALHPDEVIEMCKDMSPEEYAREMLCSFDAPVEGAYYGETINNLHLQDRVIGVPWDPAAQVFTWWDIGIDDSTAIWFVQRIGRELHIIDFLQGTGKGFDYYAAQLKAKPYTYALHVLPHDIKAREMGTGRSRFEVLSALLDADVFVCPSHKVEDGITAARSVLNLCWFNVPATDPGLSALKNYHKNVKTGKPNHNWASHAADAFRIGAVALDQTIGYVSSKNVFSLSGPLRRRLRRSRL